MKIVDSIQDRGINQVYIIGGNVTQKGPTTIYQEVRRRCLKVIVVGIPKTIDNDILVSVIFTGWNFMVMLAFICCYYRFDPTI